MKKSLFLLMLVIFSGGATGQEVAYISSDLSISMRESAESSSPVIRGVKIGTKFTIIDDSNKAMTKIRLNDGIEGWIQSRHVTTKPSSQILLDEAQETIKTLRAELAQTPDTDESNAALKEENNILKGKILQLETKIEAQTHQSGDPSGDASARSWFITGTGVVLLGILIGLFIPRLSWRKRSAWGDL